MPFHTRKENIPEPLTIFRLKAEYSVHVTALNVVPHILSCGLQPWDVKLSVTETQFLFLQKCNLEVIHLQSRY